MILALVRERPSPGWTPTEIRTALIDRGIVPPATTSAAIRVTLRRMLDRGELVRTPEGLYTLPDRAQEGTML